MSHKRSRRSAKHQLPRRTMLRGMLGGAAVTVALPALEIFLNDEGTAHADGSAFPKRFGVFFWGNGVLPWRWIPGDTGPDYTLSEQLMPLERHKSVMNVISGTDVMTGGRYPHSSAICGMLTGGALIPDGERQYWRDPTLDQYIAQRIGGSTRYRSLVTGSVPVDSSVSYTGDNQQNPAEKDPRALFQQIFVEGFRLPGDEPIIDPTVALRRSVLDAVLEQNRALQRRVGLADRRRLSDHLDHVREVELRLARLEEDPPNLAACMLPTMPPETIGDTGAAPDLELRTSLMAELLAMSFACEITRVFSHIFTRPVGDVIFPIDGLELMEGGETVIKGHHDLTHNEPDTDGVVMARVHEIMVYLMERLADFVDPFRAIEEGQGTVLDHMVLLGTTDSSNPRLHSLEDFPILTFGSCCGELVTGTHVRSSGENASRVGLSLIRAMGIPAEDWGRDEGNVSTEFTQIRT